MKKIFLITIVVFALSLTTLIAAYLFVNGQQDQVTIRETALYGNSKSAEGVSFALKACDNNSKELFWEIEHVISVRPKTTTHFQWVDAGQYDTSPIYDFIQLEDTCFINSFRADANDGTYTLPEKDPIISDVASRTDKGKRSREIHRLREYYQYYPVKLRVDVAGLNIDRASLDTDYFKIPVPEDYSITVSVEKDEDGKIIDYRIEPVHSYIYPNVEGLFREDGSFVFLADLTYEGDHEGSIDEEVDANPYLKDLKLSDEMRGIHFIPFVAKEKNESRLHADFAKARLILPLPSDSHVLRMQQSEDKEKILVLLDESHDLTFLVIDAVSKKVLQRVPLQRITGTGNMNMIKEKDGKLLIVATDGQFHLFTQKGKRYQMKFSSSFAQVKDRPQFSLWPEHWSFDYDGENLVLSTFAEISEGSYRNCSVYVFLYKQRHLEYAGYYKNSLNKENTGSESQYIIAPVTACRNKDSAVLTPIDGLTVTLN